MKEKFIQIIEGAKTVPASTWKFLIAFVVVIANAILTHFGSNPLPFSDDEVYLFFSTLLTVFSTIWSWWKNNSFTSAAIAGDIVKNEAKERGYTE